MNDSIAQAGQASEPVIRMQGVHKWFGQFHVLKDINLSVRQGERIVLCGPSGSGKSTTIRCLNRLEEHQQGRIVINGVELTSDLKQIEAIRSEVGMVFQHFNLFPHLTVLQNCTLAPMWVRKLPRRQAEEVAMHYLERVRIPEQANKYPGQLSGGQQQRVAIARAIVSDPTFLICDEPTGDLDRQSAEEILHLLQQLNREHGKTIIMVTHDPKAAEYATHTVHLDKGELADAPAAH